MYENRIRILNGQILDTLAGLNSYLLPHWLVVYGHIRSENSLWVLKTSFWDNFFIQGAKVIYIVRRIHFSINFCPRVLSRARRAEISKMVAQNHQKIAIFHDFSHFHVNIARAEVRACQIFYSIWIYLIAKNIFAPWIM